MKLIDFMELGRDCTQVMTRSGRRGRVFLRLDVKEDRFFISFGRIIDRMRWLG